MIGALEVKSQPVINFESDLRKKKVIGREKHFKNALQVWEEKNLRQQFVETASSVPASTCLCGLVQDDEKTVRHVMPVLNQWADTVNKEELRDTGFRIDCFLWTWNNASGKAKSNIVLVRFHKQKVLSTPPVVAEDSCHVPPASATATEGSTNASTDT